MMRRRVSSYLVLFVISVTTLLHRPSMAFFLTETGKRASRVACMWEKLPLPLFRRPIASKQGQIIRQSFSSIRPRPRRSDIDSFLELRASLEIEPRIQTDDTNSGVVQKIPRKFVPFPFQYHEILTLRVESLTNLGIGICRIQLPLTETNHEKIGEVSSIETTSSSKGWVVMVPNVIPGETVQCRVFRNHKSYSDADLLQIIEPSPQRIQPKCALFGECGGCQYQHVETDLQRKWKTLQVQDLFERVGKFQPTDFPETLPTLGTDEVYNYRTKLTPHYDKPIRKRDKGDGGGVEIRAIGFKKATNRQILDVPYCHIATDAINVKLTEVRENKFNESREGRLKRPSKGATMLLRDANSLMDIEGDKKVVETNPNVYVTTDVKGLTFRFMAGNFFQNNPYMLPTMVNLVVEEAVKLNVFGKNMTHLIDCYCGSGLFSLCCAAHFDHCVGIEVNDKAVEEARINAELNQIQNCKFVAASAEAIFENQEAIIPTPSLSDDDQSDSNILVNDFPRDTTVVVIDPPRKGCSPEFLGQLYDFGPERIVYMSCDPATQARDAEGIAGAGYKIVSIQPFDLFPQTRHIENLVIFEKSRN